MAEIIKTLEAWRDTSMVMDFLQSNNGCRARVQHPQCGRYRCGRLAGHSDEHWAACRQHHLCIVTWQADEKLRWAYWFSLGRGMPKQSVEKLWFTHRGEILGFFTLQAVGPITPAIVQSFEHCRSLDGASGIESDWRPRPGLIVGYCLPPFHYLPETLYYGGFRGWRYFELAAYRKTLDARMVPA